MLSFETVLLVVQVYMEPLSPDDLLVIVSTVHPSIPTDLLERMISFTQKVQNTPQQQRRYDMRHKMLTQYALFCIDVMAKRVMLSQHFVTRVVPPLVQNTPQQC
jgi:hypothetical protein